ncbi:S46 family peptidase [bacterium]|nr:MAG: S46 family peptidase [bacterium]
MYLLNRKMLNKSLLSGLFSFLLLTTGFAQKTPDDSGMWLLPQIKGAVHAEMVSKGLKLPSEAFYSDSLPSLNEAIVRVNIGQGGGGTGSFISSQGLILTNHHVAYDAIASASSAETNYLKNGFFAPTLADEVTAKEYFLYIPIEQVEVTDTLKALREANPEAKDGELRDQLTTARVNENKDLVAEIDDYFAGNKQYMVVYKVIRDVRIAFAPPSAIGKFGGDIDNWMWPRHTGDFSFLRAYVAPDGTSAEYSTENVPYVPSKHLQVDINGIHDGDFVMTLGFPGSTYRFESSFAFNFYQNHRNDYIIKAFQAALDGLEYAASLDEQVAVENASDRASIANTLKYFQGIQQGFKNYSIVERRQKDEVAFENWVNEDSERMIEYGSAVTSLKKGYEIANKTGDLVYSGVYTMRNNPILSATGILEPFYNFIATDSIKKFEKADRDTLLKHAEEFRTEFAKDADAQWITLKGHLKMLLELPADVRPVYVDEVLNPTKSESSADVLVDAFIAKQKTESLLFNKKKAEKLTKTKKSKLTKEPKDGLYLLAKGLEAQIAENRPVFASHYGFVRSAMPAYVRGMMEMSGDSTIYADANFTLRLSGGRITGYSPADGIYYTTTTTLNGVIAKNTNEEPFDVPAELLNYVAKKAESGEVVSKYALPNGNLVVNFLSTNDITGGNSGSPVLNAYGHVVGVAFDGNIEGVFGDYYFDTELKRMITCDIRYILFITEELYGQQRLVNEMEMAAKPLEVKPEPAKKMKTKK